MSEKEWVRLVVLSNGLRNRTLDCQTLCSLKRSTSRLSVLLADCPLKIRIRSLKREASRLSVLDTVFSIDCLNFASQCLCSRLNLCSPPSKRLFYVISSTPFSMKNHGSLSEIVDVCRLTSPPK